MGLRVTAATLPLPWNSDTAMEKEATVRKTQRYQNSNTCTFIYFLPSSPLLLPSSPLPVDSILLVFVILLQFWWLFWQFEGCCLFTMVRPQSKRNARALLIDIARPCFVHFRDFEKWTLLKTQSPRQSWLVRFDLISCGRVMLDLPWCNPSAPGQCPFIPASAVSTVAFSNQIIHWFV